MLLLNSSHLILTSTTNCGEALLVFRLDLDDLNVENNYVIIPIFVDCWGNMIILRCKYFLINFNIVNAQHFQNLWDLAPKPVVLSQMNSLWGTQQ